MPSRLAVGRSGVTPGVIAAMDDLLRRWELVKVRLPARRPAARNAMAAELAGAARAACAGVVGRTALLYRPCVDLPDGRRIALPDAPAE
jgi:RNA-binding protein